MNSSLRKLYDSSPYILKVAMATLNGARLNWWRGQARQQLREQFSARETWNHEQWNTWQQTQLAVVLKNARENVPYYRNLWSQRKGDSTRLEDWPLLTKSEIRAQPGLFISEKFRQNQLYKVTSSGTSGTPMNHYFDRGSMSRWYALFDSRLRRANGLTDGMRWANIGGQLVTPVQQSKPPFWTWNAAMKQLYLSSYHLRRENISFYAAALRQYRVEYVYGYSSSLYSLAKLSTELRIPLPPMKLAITNAEPLFDYQREAIKLAFGCRVVQTYGGSEFAFGASECEQNKMHLWPDAGFIEVVDFARGDLCTPGETGRFVITGLVNEAMPLIRFEIGDSGALAQNSECSCGTGTALIAKIEGRNDDLILTKNGNRIGRLDPVFKSNLPIHEAQITQVSLDRLEVRIVTADGYNSEVEEGIRKRIVERVGDMRIDFMVVDAIPRGPNGKFKAVVSLLRS